MDETNPAVGKQLQIPPAMLEAIGSDPKVASSIARKMWLVQADQMHRRMRDPNAPLGLKQGFIDHLAKVGDVVPKQVANASAPGAGFSVSINFSSPPPARALKGQPADLPLVEVVDNTPSTDTPSAPDTAE